MSATDTALPLRIGARTLWTLRRRLVRRRITLDEALGESLPALAPLGAEDDGYLLFGLPASLADRLVARNDDLKPFVRQAYRHGFARLDQDFESYLAGFSTKSRSTCRRKLKKLAERSGGALDVRCYRSEEEIARFHAGARAVSAMTYQERLLDAGLPDGPEALAELRSLARRGLARGWLLYLDDRAIAYLYAPAEGDALLYAHLGYDPAFAEFSPGTVLQLEVMRQLMEEREFSLFDFTEGEGQHKSLFATDAIDCVDLLLVRPTLANLLVGYALSGFDVTIALIKKLGGAGLARRFRR